MLWSFCMVVDVNSLVSDLPLLSSNGLPRLLEVNKYNEIHTPQKVVMCYKLYIVFTPVS